MTELDNRTIFIHIDSGEYPITAGQFRERVKGTWLLPEHFIDEAVANYEGYAVVEPTEQPPGDVVTEVSPIFAGGRFIQAWVSRPFNAEEIASNLEARKRQAEFEVLEARNWTREHGAPLTLPGRDTFHIQLRESDIANLTGLSLKAERAPDRQYYFRPYENTVVECNGSEMVHLTDHAFVKFEQMMMECWRVQQDISDAEAIEQVPSRETIRERINQSVL